MKIVKGKNQKRILMGAMAVLIGFVFIAAVQPSAALAANVTSVDTNRADGLYNKGTFDLRAEFDEVVLVSGVPRIALNTSPARTADYVSGSGSDTLVFRYTICPGDTSSDLGYLATDSLELNGGSIKNTSGSDADLTLPNPATFTGAHDIAVDTAPPAVAGFSPANCATDIPIDTQIVITFNEDVSPGAFFDSLTIKTLKSTMPFTYSIVGDTLTLTPKFALSNSMSYTVTIPQGALKDAAGNSNKYTRGFSFTTVAPAGAQPPVVNEAESYPRRFARDAAINRPIVIKFNEVVLEGPTFKYITLKENNNRDVRITNKKIKGGVLTIYTINKKKNTRYTLTLPAGAVKDKQGNVLAEPYRLTFTTKAR